MRKCAPRCFVPSLPALRRTVMCIKGIQGARARARSESGPSPCDGLRCPLAPVARTLAAPPRLHLLLSALLIEALLSRPAVLTTVSPAARLTTHNQAFDHQPGPHPNLPAVRCNQGGRDPSGSTLRICQTQGSGTTTSYLGRDPSGSLGLHRSTHALTGENMGRPARTHSPGRTWAGPHARVRLAEHGRTRSPWRT